MSLKIFLKLDRRKQMKDGKFPIKVYLSEDRKTRMVTTGYACYEDQFDVINECIIGRSFYRENDKLTSILRRCRIECEGKHLVEALKICKAICDGDAVVHETFGEYWKRQLKGMELSPSSIRSYGYAFNHLDAFRSMDSLFMSDITVTFVGEWIKHLHEHTNLSNNTICLYAGMFRHIVNYAIDDELIVQNPFRRVRLKRTQTRKRCITLEQLQCLRDSELTGLDAYARDIFMLSFYLIGINPIDLYNLKEIENGRIVYYRAKTKKLYDIKVEPEAMALIEKHRGKNTLLDLADRYKSARIMKRVINVRLKRQIPDLTLYWARHSWATLASSLDVSIDTISLALGHSFGNEVTNIYIKHDVRKVDFANRLVLNTLAVRHS